MGVSLETDSVESEESVKSEDDGITISGHAVDGHRPHKVCLALVGLGRAGHFHLQSLVSLADRAYVKYVVDVNDKLLKKVSSKLGYKSSETLECVLADDEVQGVIIASTTSQHFAQIKACFEAGKAVFAEKPISMVSEQLEEIIDFAKRTELPFLVGYQRRYDLNFRDLKAEIDAGAIGAPRVIKVCSRDNPLPPLSYLEVSGGLFHDMLCHDFDMIHYLTGQFPDSVYSMGHCYNDDIRDMGDIDTAVIALSFPSGMMATVDTSRVAEYGYDQRVEVFGELGMAQAHNVPASTVQVATTAGHRTPRAQWTFSQRYPQAYLTELEHFVELVGTNSTLPEEELTRHVLLERVTAAAELSWKRGQRVWLSELAG